MRFPKGIALRITLLGWLVTLITLGVFIMVIVPEQKHEFELSLESKARGVAVSLRGVAAGRQVSPSFSIFQADRSTTTEKPSFLVTIT